MCLSPCILRTSEREPGWPRGSQEFPFCPEPTRAGYTMTTSPPTLHGQHLLPGSPLVALLSRTCCFPTSSLFLAPPCSTPCSSLGPAVCSDTQPGRGVEPGEVAQRLQRPVQLYMTSRVYAYNGLHFRASVSSPVKWEQQSLTSSFYTNLTAWKILGHHVPRSESQ